MPFKGIHGQYVFGIGGVILFPKDGLRGGCFREFSGPLKNIDNAELKGLAVGLEFVVNLFLSCKIPKGATIHIRYDNEKLKFHLNDTFNEGDTNFSDLSKQIRERIYYSIFLLTTHGLTLTHEHISRDKNKFASSWPMMVMQYNLKIKAGRLQEI